MADADARKAAIKKASSQVRQVLRSFAAPLARSVLARLLKPFRRHLKNLVNDPRRIRALAPIATVAGRPTCRGVAHLSSRDELMLRALCFGRGP
jgi:hypothetical protein